MSFINNNMKWIMLVSGAITFTIIFAAFAPQLALTSMFGSSLEGPLAEVVVRNWGALIALIGGMLIYGAYKIDVRNLILSVAVLSKITFISLVISYGFGVKLLPAITFDAVLILIFCTYIFSTQKNKKA